MTLRSGALVPMVSSWMSLYVCNIREEVTVEKTNWELSVFLCWGVEGGDLVEEDGSWGGGGGGGGGLALQVSHRGAGLSVQSPRPVP